MGPMGGSWKLILGSKCLGLPVNGQLCIANSFPLSSAGRYQPGNGYVGSNMALGAVGMPGRLVGLCQWHRLVEF